MDVDFKARNEEEKTYNVVIRPAGMVQGPQELLSCIAQLIKRVLGGNGAGKEKGEKWRGKRGKGGKEKTYTLLFALLACCEASGIA